MSLPAPPVIAGIEWRPLRRDDAGAVAGLLDAAFEADGGYRITPVEVEEELDDGDNDPARDTIAAVTPAGRVVAMAWCRIPSGVESEWRVFPWNEVHPDYRGRGIGSFLLAWFEARGRERLAGLDDGLPRVFRDHPYEFQPGTIALLEANGYEPVRYFTELVRDLSADLAAAVLPVDITVAGWSSDAASGHARLVHNQAFADHWGSQPIPVARWEQFQNEFFMTEASFVAYDGSTPVGYLMSSKYPHDWEDRGRTEAWIEGLGTVRSHRRRGIASGLIAKALAVFAAAGLEYACLGVDSESETGADRLYVAHGFVPERRSIAYVKKM